MHLAYAVVYTFDLTNDEMNEVGIFQIRKV